MWPSSLSTTAISRKVALSLRNCTIRRHDLGLGLIYNKLAPFSTPPEEEPFKS
jgi:hypothetical protein